ncbi:hypothetical protein FRC06_009669, partial [Ceratobasidium sp. 370]
FGLSVLEHSKIAFSSTENPGGGSTRWMAPELITDSTGRSFKADVYALGMTFIEILTGEYPFPELGDVNIMFAVATTGKIPARPERLTMQSPRYEKWWELLQKCWSREPSMRPKASDWEALDRGLNVPAEPVSLQPGDNAGSARLPPAVHTSRPRIANIVAPAAPKTSEGSLGDSNELNDGTYYIYNASSGNKAIVPLNAVREDLVGSYKDELKGAKWVFERQPNTTKYSIKSADYNLYAACPHMPSGDGSERVFTSERTFQWVIQPVGHDKNDFVIEHVEDKLYWGLEDDGYGAPITLQVSLSNTRNHWRVVPVEGEVST